VAQVSCVIQAPVNEGDSILGHILSRPDALPGVTIVSWSVLLVSPELAEAGIPDEINDRLTRLDIDDVDLLCGKTNEELLELFGNEGVQSITRCLASLQPPRSLRIID